jgi:hypothetical protein
MLAATAFGDGDGDALDEVVGSGVTLPLGAGAGVV